ncbi:Cytochrome P450 [Corchorus capsularis]|uniref:Cytochrome P450 n=1 Tax=Corchorus capsularis TaxID=210143 RepID=A0A1R3GAB2_COCAP|nr:Cytochrome P450 [Corchorus capsularis]
MGLESFGFRVYRVSGWAGSGFGLGSLGFRVSDHTGLGLQVTRVTGHSDFGSSGLPIIRVSGHLGCGSFGSWVGQVQVVHFFLSNQIGRVGRILRDFGVAVRFAMPISHQLGPKISTIFVIANPENVEYILKTRFENYPKGKAFSMILGDLLGKGIFNVDGDLWMFQKKMASLELANISIKAYAFEIITKEIKHRLLPLLSSFSGQNGSIFDLQDAFRRFSFDNVFKFSFGLDPGCLESSLPISQFADAIDLASKLSAERAMAPLPLLWKIKRIFQIGSEKKLKEAIKVVDALAMEVIMQKRKLGFSTHEDLLSRFMACIKDDSYLRDIVISFIIAGRDTMASSLTTFFWLLANHPQVISKILNESNQFMESTMDQEFASYDQIRQMHYLHAAGTRVTYHPYAMGRMDNIWGSDCIEFKPERWLKEDGTFCPQCPFKYPVFQAGVRVCLGKELALVGMKMVALSVLRRFDFELVAHIVPPKFDPGLTAMVKGGLQVVVRERRDNIAAA